MDAQVGDLHPLNCQQSAIDQRLGVGTVVEELPNVLPGADLLSFTLRRMPMELGDDYGPIVRQLGEGQLVERSE
jgi:hypothetical protein